MTRTIIAASFIAIVAAAAAAVQKPQLTTASAAAAVTFDFKDPKGVNAIGFFVDSELEPIMGFVRGIEGEITYDPSSPESFRGEIRFAATDIACSNPRMSQVLAGADWLSAEQFGRVAFTFNGVSAANRVDDHTARLTVSGRLELRGVTIDKPVEITATHVPGGAAKRGAAKSGDLLVLRSSFAIDRTDFNLKPEGPFNKVGRAIDLNVAIAGYSK